MPIRIIAAPHTPFTSDGELNVAPIESLAYHLVATGVRGVFVAGSTGEGHSLSLDERKELTECWAKFGKAAGLQVIIQVGHNCQRDAIELARHAADSGVDAISSMAPCYFRPQDARQLVDFLAPIAASSGALPFYFYDIPAMTGVSISTVELLQIAADEIPSMKGVKFTNPDLVQFQQCTRWNDGQFDIWFGCDEALLAGYSLGATGAVGSTYNFVAPLYRAIVEAFDSGAVDAARRLQLRSVELINLLQRYGYPAAAKFVMKYIGIDLGPCRSPLKNLSQEQENELWQALDDFELLSNSSFAS